MTEIFTPIWKIAATVGGTALTGVAVWMNAGHISHAEGWGSPLVAAGVVVTLCAAVTPPVAERAAKTGQPAKATVLWLFFGLAVLCSLSASISRSSGYADGKVAEAEQANTKAQLAQEAYDAAKAIQAAECVKRTSRCRAAETTLATARNALGTAAPVTATDPGAERLAAVLGIDADAVRLYLPLLLPLGLELGGFIFLALGLAPRRREDKIVTAGQDVATRDADAAAAPVQKPVAASAKRGSAAYYLQRLDADHPAIASRVHAGELSVYAASIAAGLRKAPAKASAKWTKADAYMQASVPT